MNRALDEAAFWCARLQAPSCSPQQHRLFQQWLQAHPDNVEAYAMTEALSWDLHERFACDPRLAAKVDQAYALGAWQVDAQSECPEAQGALYDYSASKPGQPCSKGGSKTGLSHLPTSGLDRRGESSQRRSSKDRTLEALDFDRKERPKACGSTPSPNPGLTEQSWWAKKLSSRSGFPASLATAAGIMAAVLVGSFKLAGFDATQAIEYGSPSSEQLTVKLQDGTNTHLDINSVVNVTMDAESRTVELVKGRAIFDVAPDPSRPFSVTVGNSQVMALGTRFQVQRDEQKMVVTLEEGLVDVIGQSSGIVQRQHLHPGDQLKIRLTASAPWEKSRVEVDSVTSWSRGRHVFRGVSLAESLEEVNRYSSTKIRLGDPQLKEMVISGNFVIGDSRAVASAIVAALPLRLVDVGSELVLFPVYSEELLHSGG